jgi:hypothetical protein
MFNIRPNDYCRINIKKMARRVRRAILGEATASVRPAASDENYFPDTA